MNNGTPPDPNSADITLAGGLFGTQQSVNNCVSNNPCKGVPKNRLCA